MRVTALKHRLCEEREREKMRERGKRRRERG